jgi:hypothetical protein
VLLAFDQACEQRDLSAAEQLVRVLEMTHRRGREMVTLIAAYERLWKLQHNIWKPSPRVGASRPPGAAELRARAQSARGHASNFAGDVAEPRMFELTAELEAQATAAYIRGADQA